MRSQQEIEQAAKLFAWYAHSRIIRGQDAATRENITGSWIALDWVMGGGTGPMADSLALIAMAHEMELRAAT